MPRENELIKLYARSLGANTSTFEDQIVTRLIEYEAAKRLIIKHGLEAEWKERIESGRLKFLSWIAQKDDAELKAGV